MKCGQVTLNMCKKKNGMGSIEQEGTGLTQRKATFPVERREGRKCGTGVGMSAELKGSFHL